MSPEHLETLVIYYHRFLFSEEIDLLRDLCRSRDRDNMIIVEEILYTKIREEENLRKLKE